jgi:hypothetical protein
MKRPPELRDLSDHHHRGLVQARRLRMAATGDGANLHEEIEEAFLEFWPCKSLQNRSGGTRTRTGDTMIFSHVLYHLSYPAV